MDILQRDNNILRKQAEAIAPETITDTEVQTLITQMFNTLATQKDGVALAAPQIGVSRQIFVIAPFVFKHPKDHHQVYINPRIVSKSTEIEVMHEGCLSCRWTVGDVKRHIELEVAAYDEHGLAFSEKLDGLLAHIAQHEIDHLHGILFIDKAMNMREMTDEEIQEVTG